MTGTVATAIRVLTFRATAAELHGLDRSHLRVGLLCTWIVGMGRWWEDPNASLLQHLGVGSLVYVFVLAALLWAVVRPLAPATSYLNVATYVSLTAPPAILYAVPVRAWLPLETAQEVRLWFLGVVATWRVLLWARYLIVGAGTTRVAAVVTTLLPMTLIVFGLWALNLERVVFDFMRGVDPKAATVNDHAYEALFILTYLSILAFVPLLLAYVFSVARARTRDRVVGPS